MNELKYITNLKNIEDSRGNIIVMTQEDIPFIIKRVFVIFHQKGSRGNHAHKITHQFLVCLKGSAKAKIINKYTENYFILNDKCKSLYVPPMTWLELSDINAGSIIMVFASEAYEEKDYINNFDEFVKLLKGGNNGS